MKRFFLAAIAAATLLVLASPLSVTAQPAIGVEQVTELNSVHFELNSATLTSAGESRLRENLELLREFPELQYAVAGFGQPGESPDLPRRRAEAVVQFLRQHGATNCHVAVAYGILEATRVAKEGRQDQLRLVSITPFTCEGCSQPEVIVEERIVVQRDTVTVSVPYRVVEYRDRPAGRLKLPFIGEVGLTGTHGSLTGGFDGAVADEPRRELADTGMLSTCHQSGVPLGDQCGTQRTSTLGSAGVYVSALFPLGNGGFAVGPTAGIDRLWVRGQLLPDAPPIFPGGEPLVDTRDEVQDATLAPNAGVAGSYQLGRFAVGVRAVYAWPQSTEHLEVQPGFQVGLTAGIRF